MNDSVPDKLAAQRAASGNLKLENEEDRWGFEAARARRRDTVKKSQTGVFPLPSHTTAPTVDAGQP